MIDDKTKFCPYCGTMIPYLDDACPACGEPQPELQGMEQKPKKTQKNMWLAVLLSFLITGLGQVYLGKWKRGVRFFMLTLLIGFIASYYFKYEQVITMGALLSLISAYDAYQLAKKENV